MVRNTLKHRMPTALAAIGLVTTVGLAHGKAKAQTSFTPLADLPGGTTSGRAWAIDAGGGVVSGVGNDGSDAGALWRFSAGGWGGPVNLPRLTGGTSANARGCAASGATAFGDATDSGGFGQPVRWTIVGNSATVATLAFPPTGGYSGAAYACSADGTVACGQYLFAPPSGGGPPPLPITKAFRWTATGGMVDLGTLPGVTPFSAQTTSARAMSNDGNTIVGYADDAGFNKRPWRWTAGTGIVDLTGGAWTGFARGCSPDGSIVVGNRNDVSPSIAFLGTDILGMQDLGTIGTVGSTTYDTSFLLDMSLGGCRGAGLCSASAISGSQLACIWEPGIGWRSIKQVLSDAGINMTGWTLNFANSLSDDGQVIAGYGVNPSGQTQAWVARIPLPRPGDVNGDGAINGRDVAAFVQLLGASYPAAGTCTADLNHDGTVESGDVGPLVGALLGG